MESSNNTTGATPGDAARRVKDAAADIVDHTKEAARTTVERSTTQAASSVQRASRALHRAASEAETENSWVGALMHKSAEKLDQAASALDGADINGVAGRISDFARREPALFLGASLALGFALARVGKVAVEQNVDGADRSPEPLITPGM